MIYPVPKPVRVPRERHRLRNKKSLKRTRMKCGAGSKRRGKSSFPKQRDKKFCRFVIEETDCVGLHRMFRRRISPNDWPTVTWFVHVCWGPHDPAHVGQHRSKGAPDFGRVVNMCRALHDFYDQHRSKFARAANLTQRKLEHIAQGNAVKYVELGGTASPPRDPT